MPPLRPSDRTYLREGLLLLGFLLLLAASTASVVVPELGKAPEADSASPAPDAGTSQP